MITFKLFDELTHSEKKIIDEIFFASSAVKKFQSIDAKEKFHYKYLGVYQKNYSKLFLCILKDNIPLGYICGVTDSIKATELFELLSHYKMFEDLYAKFPAHLHINLSPESTGLGLGSILISEFEKRLVKLNILGVHLITGPDSRNVNFYRKNGYLYDEKRSFNDSSLLFLGKNLTS